MTTSSASRTSRPPEVGGKKKPGRPKGSPALTRPEATVFGHVVSALGMTHAEAGSFLGLSAQTVRYYATGTRKAPDKVMEKVADLWTQVSFRQESDEPLPYPAAKRREALQAIRRRSWTTPDDPGGDGYEKIEIDGLE